MRRRSLDIIPKENICWRINNDMQFSEKGLNYPFMKNKIHADSTELTKQFRKFRDKLNKSSRKL